jgi:transposase
MRPRAPSAEAMTALLDLEEFEVVEASEDRKSRRRDLVVVPCVAVALCPHCRQVCQDRHACHDRQVLDLPMGSYATHLTVRQSQFHCRHCDKFFTPPLAGLAEGAHATERLLTRLAELVKHADVSAASAFFGVPEKTLEKWYYDHVRRLERQGPLRPIRTLGVDELSLKNGTSSSASC